MKFLSFFSPFSPTMPADGHYSSFRVKVLKIFPHVY